jgi:hypothetical protein
MSARRRNLLALLGPSPIGALAAVSVLLQPACTTVPFTPEVTLSPEGPRTTDDLVADHDGVDAESYSWSWYQDGTLREDLASDMVPAAETSKGEVWTIEVVGTTGKKVGEVGSAEVLILNTPPVAQATGSAETPLSSDDVVVTATATDADDDDVTFTYAWTVNDAASPITGPTVPANETTKGEIWQVTVTPNDGEADGEPVVVTFSIDNLPPELVSVDLTPTEAYEYSTFEVTWDGGDGDDDPLTPIITWLVNDAVVLEGETATLEGEHFNKGDAVSVSVVLNDGYADSDTLTAGPVTVLNTPPNFTGVAIDPTEAYEASTLTCTGSGWFDLDGDAEGFTTSWAVNGTAVSTDTTLDGASFNKADQVTCTLTANDGTDDGTSLTTDALTILNTAPVLADASLSSAAPTVTEDLTVTPGTSSDDDGDSVSYVYAWYINSSISGETSATLPAGSFSKGDSIYAQVTPWDGEDYGTPVTTGFATAANSAPSVDSVTLTPTSAYTNDVLTASTSTSDADGDSVSLSYAWYVDGSLVAETGSSLDGATYFDRDQVVYVDVTPNDGTDDGTALSASSVTILNSVPTDPEIDLLPDSPLEGTDDLFCDVTVASTDADGDAITYVFAWDYDGTAFSSTSTTTYTDDTVDTAYPVVGELWTCTVYADDGTDTSAADTDSVTIIDWEGARDFDNCGATGATGPVQADCDTSYTSTTLEGEVTVSAGLQTWTVPSDGDYVIEAWGAMGYSAETSYVGGSGAYASGVFTLSAGDVLTIAVGQMGTTTSNHSGGGGGGSFVVDASQTPLVIAGGGGGNRDAASQDGCDGRADQYGGNGSGSSSTNSCAASSVTLGEGGEISGSSWGSGGGGFNSGGESEYVQVSSTWGGYGGDAFVDGAAGGAGNSYCGSAEGGFGGGGSGNGCWGGGGGGGYTGGDGGLVAGGGGSYVDSSGTSVVLTAGANAAHGAVTIDLDN